jgi:hypothetical protein
MSREWKPKVIEGKDKQTEREIHIGHSFKEYGYPKPWTIFDSDPEFSNYIVSAIRCHKCIPYLKEQLMGLPEGPEAMGCEIDLGPAYDCLKVAAIFDYMIPYALLNELTEHSEGILPGKDLFGKFGGGLGGRQAIIFYPDGMEVAELMKSQIDDGYSSRKAYKESKLSHGCQNLLGPIFGETGSQKRKPRVKNPDMIKEIIRLLG